MDFSGTFDTTNALSGIFLWITFGYMAALLNCDLQRFLKHNPLAIHVVGLVAFFFLFTLLDTNNKGDISTIVIKTVFVYVLFMMMTKSKWYFVVPVICMLLLDQTIKKRVVIQEVAGKNVEKEREVQQRITRWLNVAIVSLIIVGTLHYMFLQYIEYRHAFSLYRFFLGVTKCKKSMPDYSKMGKP